MVIVEEPLFFLELSGFSHGIYVCESRDIIVNLIMGNHLSVLQHYCKILQKKKKDSFKLVSFFLD